MRWPVPVTERSLPAPTVRVLNAYDGAKVYLGGTFRVPGGHPDGRLLKVFHIREVDGRDVMPAIVDYAGKVQRSLFPVRRHVMRLYRGGPTIWRWRDAVIPT